MDEGDKMFLENIPILRELTIVSITFRLLLCVIIGGVLGLEREMKRRPAGFRTYILVCLGSAIVMMTGQYLQMISGSGDPARLPAQVVSGIGFLGAGTILTTKGNHVRGLTTAAGLWSVACIGLTVGCGFYSLAISGFLGILISLAAFHQLDSYFCKRSRITMVYMELKSRADVRGILEHSKTNAYSISNLEIGKFKNYEGKQQISCTMELRFKNVYEHDKVMSDYEQLPGVIFIEEIGGI